MVAFATEVDLARVVTEWLEGQGFEISPEVQIEEGGPVADIVAVRGPVIWVIETKLKYGVGVLEQALYWRPQCSRVSIAVPRPAAPHRRTLVERLDLGMIYVDEGGADQVIWRPTRKIPHGATLPSLLTGVHQQWGADAGSSNGHMTKFQVTARKVVQFVREAEEPVTVQEIVSGIDHHYFSDEVAVKALAGFIRKGVIRGVRRTGQGKWMKVYAEEA